MESYILKRRNFIGATCCAGLSRVFCTKASANAASFPVITHGCSIGEVTSTSAIVWFRVSDLARIYVDIDTSAEFNSPKTFGGILSSPDKDNNCKIRLAELKPNTKYYFKAYCEPPSPSRDKQKELIQKKQLNNVELGSFITASSTSKNNIRFCWSGDTAGQGYGIDTAHGGMLSYKAMLDRDPDFFVHCGDQIYADNPIEAEKAAPDGVVWKNLITVPKLKVAESIQEFRENYYYNFQDVHFKNFHSHVPVYHMWDDHEVVNNWYHGAVLDDERYTEKQVTVLADRARQAFLDCLPISEEQERQDHTKLYRHIPRGPLLDLFFIDLRSYKSANSVNRQPEESEATQFFGEDQLEWLKQSLLESKGLWKMVCIDMPLSVRVTNWGTDIAENAANGPGPALGRELEYKKLFEFIKQHHIKNVHFITADVHYCASYEFKPERAVEKNFIPFWEFISGPLHAGTFGPGEIDPTFGPSAEFIGLPKSYPAGASPAANLQFFGEIDINANTKTMTVRHINRLGKVLWQKEIEPLT